MIPALHWTATKEQRLDAVRKKMLARQQRDSGPMDNPPMPNCSTGHQPGSLEKIEIMRRRVEAGLHLHHPCVAKDLM